MAGDGTTTATVLAQSIVNNCNEEASVVVNKVLEGKRRFATAPPNLRPNHSASNVL